MNKKSKIFLIIFCLIIILGFIAYLLVPKWQIYKNEEFGFELKYPKNLILNTSVKDEYYTFSIIDSNRKNTYFELYIQSKGWDYAEPKGPFPLITKSTHYSEEISKDSLNNIDGYSAYSSVEGGGGVFKSFFFIHGEYIWTVNNNPNNEDEYTTEEYKNNLDIQNKIRDSFRLI